jgi:hypothetical protein
MFEVFSPEKDANLNFVYFLQKIGEDQPINWGYDMITNFCSFSHVASKILAI